MQVNVISYYHNVGLTVNIHSFKNELKDKISAVIETEFKDIKSNNKYGISKFKYNTKKDLLLQFINWRSKIIVSDVKFEMSDVVLNEINKTDITFWDRFKVNPNEFHSPNPRTGLNNADFFDQLFTDWNILHAHLHSSGTGLLLYYVYDFDITSGYTIYPLGIFAHELDFASEEMLKRIFLYFPLEQKMLDKESAPYEERKFDNPTNILRERKNYNILNYKIGEKEYYPFNKNVFGFTRDIFGDPLKFIDYILNDVYSTQNVDTVQLNSNLELELRNSQNEIIKYV